MFAVPEGTAPKIALPETNSSHLKIAFGKGDSSWKASFFRECNSWNMLEREHDGLVQMIFLSQGA